MRMTYIYIFIAVIAFVVLLSSQRVYAQKPQPKTYIFFDTETTGLPKNYRAPAEDTANWPRLVQLSWVLTDDQGNVLGEGNEIVRPEGYTIPEESSRIHGITTERAMKEGDSMSNVLAKFYAHLQRAECMVGHNIDFDRMVVGAEYIRAGRGNVLKRLPYRCTMKESTNYCKLPGKIESKYKWPKLMELHQILFGEGFDDAHDASADIAATVRCFFELKRRGVM